MSLTPLPRALTESGLLRPSSRHLIAINLIHVLVNDTRIHMYLRMPCSCCQLDINISHSWCMSLYFVYLTNLNTLLHPQVYVPVEFEYRKTV